MCSCKKIQTPRQLFNGKPIPVPKGYDKQFTKAMVKVLEIKDSKKT